MPRPERLSIPIPSQIEDPSFDENAYLVTQLATALAIDSALVSVAYDTDTETWLATAGSDIYAFQVGSDDDTYAFVRRPDLAIEPTWDAPLQFTADAALATLDRFLESPDSVTPTELASARQTLRAIRAQRGCEDLDPAVTDGRLTTAIDVLVFG